MKNRKNTRRALVMSLLALLVCCSMLVGTTFAWFTDSVSTANNIIKSGNLDITLEYYDTVAKEWKDATDASDILTGDLWEPGYVDVAYLRLKNAGSLALKYQLGVNIVSEKEGTNKAGATFKLSDYIYFDVVEGQQPTFADRAEAMKYATETTKISAGYAKAGTLEANAPDAYLAMVVYMPSTVDNVANHDGTNVPKIDLGINVLAAQLASEEDSFNDQYDAGATWLGNADTSWYDANATEFVISTPEQLAGLAEIINGGTDFTATIKLGGNIDLSGAEWTPIGIADYFSGTFDGAGYTISGLTISGEEEAAFFGYIGPDATVKNVNFANADIEAESAGVLAVYINGATIENVHVLSGSVKAADYAAAFAAQQAYYGATFKNCTNYATITSDYIAAGFGGYLWYNCEVEDCVNYGDVTGGNRAGGIAAHVGGVFKNCENNGEIISNGSMPAGGIGAVLGNASTIEGCVNNGNVTNNGTNAGNAQAAGILGHAASASLAAATTIRNCTNNGDITAANSDAAGIAVSHYGSLTAIECENNGAVYGKTGAAGVLDDAGMFSGTNTVTDCTNNGAVTTG